MFLMFNFKFLWFSLSRTHCTRKKSQTKKLCQNFLFEMWSRPEGQSIDHSAQVRMYLCMYARLLPGSEGIVKSSRDFQGQHQRR